MTIKCHQGQHLFGEIVGGEMVLNELGNIVWWEWVKCEHIRKEIFMDEFVVMPNHFHGIVFIQKPSDTPANQTIEPVGTTGPLSLQTPQRKPGGGKRSLSSMIGAFKLKSAIKINELRQTPRAPVWQTRFYDRIIRNEDELNRIRQYIQNNPLNWSTDEDNA